MVEAAPNMIEQGEIRTTGDVTVALGDHLETFVDDQVAPGRYGTVSEVIRDALRMLEDDERKFSWLREQMADAEAQFRAGNVHEDSDEFWEDLDRAVDQEL